MKPQLLSYFTFNQLTETHSPYLNPVLIKPQCKPIQKSVPSSNTNNQNRKKRELPSIQDFEETEFLNSLVSIII
ncbi:MAG: hypothetical protein ACON35_07080 [Candidatus Marinamargulisbacteria bacterium]